MDGKCLLLAMVVLLPVLSGCLQSEPKPHPIHISSSLDAEDDQVKVQILDFAALQQLIASHRGKVVVMDCWSTSCTPCIQEFPEFVTLAKDFGPDRVACISLSFDYEGTGTPEEQLPRVRDFLQQQNAWFDNVLSSDDSDQLRAKLKLPSIPAIYVYDQSGALRKRFDNAHAATEADHFAFDQINELVRELLDEPNEATTTEK